MRAAGSQITGVPIVCSTVCSGGDQRKHQSSALLAFVRGIHRCPVYSPHKGPVTRKMFPFDDVIMLCHGWNATTRYYLSKMNFKLPASYSEILIKKIYSLCQTYNINHILWHVFRLNIPQPRTWSIYSFNHGLLCALKINFPRIPTKLKWFWYTHTSHGNALITSVIMNQ